MCKYKLYLGDNRINIKELEDNSVDSIITDPPYEIGFCGKSWDSSGIAYDISLWKEGLRILKPGGYLLAFSSARTYHRLAVAIEDSGFEIRDQIMWIYSQGMPKSMNVAKLVDTDLRGCRQGKVDFKSPMHNQVNSIEDIYEYEFEESKKYIGIGTSIKPCHEPIVIARKPLIGTISQNILKYNTGGINIDECRIPFSENDDIRVGKDYTHKAMAGITPGEGKKYNIDGHETLLYKNNGRFPGNIIHDGSEEILNEFNKFGNHEGRSSNGNAKYQEQSKNIPLRRGKLISRNDSGSVSRFYYCAKATTKDRNEDLNNCKNIHTTVKPTELMEYLVKLFTPKNGTCVDIFMGSGSTGKAAMLTGYNFIGFEINEEYYKISKERIEGAKNKYLNETKDSFEDFY